MKKRAKRLRIAMKNDQVRYKIQLRIHQAKVQSSDLLSGSFLSLQLIIVFITLSRSIMNTKKNPQQNVIVNQNKDHNHHKDQNHHDKKHNQNLHDKDEHGHSHQKHTHQGHHGHGHTGPRSPQMQGKWSEYSTHISYKIKVPALIIMILVWLVAYWAVNQNKSHGHIHGHGHGHGHADGHGHIKDLQSGHPKEKKVKQTKKSH